MPRLGMKCGDGFMIGMVCLEQYLAQWTDQGLVDSDSTILSA